MNLQEMNDAVAAINGLLFHDYVIYTLLGTGILFTIWSGFGQFRALTHGSAVVRGKYDDGNDPGAISHFQALSAALSATVGLGNIGGVATAVAIGGPGAVFWMWVIGVIGMSLKMVEVTQSMLYRNMDDPDNPHGGPMFVVGSLLKKDGGTIGAMIGGIFCITLLLSAFFGGNMFQAWNVAEVTTQYFQVPFLKDQAWLNGMAQNPNFNPETLAIGILLAVIVGAVIIGGIKRIGAVASTIVPFMCLLYLGCGLVVLGLNVGAIPELVMDIIRSGLGLGGYDATGAFLGGSFGMAFAWGIKRALFSSEAGQGSAPIAHAAAKSHEPVREGVVAGLEPFIDTIVVCTVTALVIMSTGAWKRGAEAVFPDDAAIVLEQTDGGWMLSTPPLPHKTDEAKRIGGVGTADPGWRDRDRVFMIARPVEEDRAWLAANGFDVEARSTVRINGDVAAPAEAAPEADDAGGVAPAPRPMEVRWKPLPPMVIDLDPGPTTPATDPTAGSEMTAETDPAAETGPAGGASPTSKTIRLELADRGVWEDYPGASLTAHAFDRAFNGYTLPVKVDGKEVSMGGWLVTIAAWLFAISTMISWSYYGEQGVVYLFGDKIAGMAAVTAYRIVYVILIAVSCIGFIKTDAQLDNWTTLGLGAMLVANIPIMLIFGPKAMSAYHDYIRRLKAGEFEKKG